MYMLTVDVLMTDDKNSYSSNIQHVGRVFCPSPTECNQNNHFLLYCSVQKCEGQQSEYASPDVDVSLPLYLVHVVHGEDDGAEGVEDGQCVQVPVPGDLR